MNKQICDTQYSPQDALLEALDRDNNEFTSLYLKQICVYIDALTNHSERRAIINSLLTKVKDKQLLFQFFDLLPKDLQKNTLTYEKFLDKFCKADLLEFVATRKYTTRELLHRALNEKDVEVATALIQAWNPESISFADVYYLSTEFPAVVAPKDQLKQKLRALLESRKNTNVEGTKDISFAKALQCAFGFQGRTSALNLLISTLQEMEK